MTRTRLGIQTIIFGKRTSDDFEGVLTDIKAAGYDGVEFGFRADSTTPQVKATLDRIGLSCCGYHAGYNVFTELDNLRAQAEQLVGVGGHYFMCSGTEGWQKGDADSYKRSCEVFNRAAVLLKNEFNLTFCYHNHDWEFKTLSNGEKGMNMILLHTDPTLVKLCVDVFWVACAGENPADFIRLHNDRAVYFHLKDGTFDPETHQRSMFMELGRGMVDLKSAMEAIRELSPEWVVTEQDQSGNKPEVAARISADYARQELAI
jgi:sugar phosphate isomerase/epimerase